VLIEIAVGIGIESIGETFDNDPDPDPDFDFDFDRTCSCFATKLDASARMLAPQGSRSSPEIERCPIASTTTAPTTTIAIPARRSIRTTTSPRSEAKLR